MFGGKSPSVIFCVNPFDFHPADEGGGEDIADNIKINNPSD